MSVRVGVNGFGRSAIVPSEPSVAEVNDAFAHAASGAPAGIVEYSDDPLVPSDIVGSPASCVFDAGLTMTSGPLVKVYGWYDNEWGYANRLAELAAFVDRLVEGHDYHVNNAFGAACRDHGSIVDPPARLPSAAGRLVAHEVEVLSGLLASPRLGGGRVVLPTDFVVASTDDPSQVEIDGSVPEGMEWHRHRP
jgi:hypothetical protein